MDLPSSTYGRTATVMPIGRFDCTHSPRPRFPKVLIREPLSHIVDLLGVVEATGWRLLSDGERKVRTS